MLPSLQRKNLLKAKLDKSRKQPHKVGKVCCGTFLYCKLLFLLTKKIGRFMLTFFPDKVVLLHEDILRSFNFLNLIFNLIFNLK